MKSDKLLEMVHRLVTDGEAREQFASAPVAFLSRVGISPETARALAPVMATVLTTGVFLAAGGNSPEYQWDNSYPS